MALQVSTLPEVTAEYKKDKRDHGGGGLESRILGHKWSERGNGKSMNFNWGLGEANTHRGEDGLNNVSGI